MSYGKFKLGIIISTTFIFISVPVVKAEIPGKISIGGNYIGLINTFDVDNSTAADSERDQFDFAANIDFEWEINPDIIITLQLQGGSGGGSLGLQGPGPVVTDLNVAFNFEDQNFVFTMGSFDAPFGEQTESLTNNADSFRNPLLLNSIFYSSFGGTVGTLNTLGVMGTLSRQAADITLAITNGTSESSENPDGNFGWVLSIGTDAGLEGLRIAGSYMQSDDLPDPGLSGDIDNDSMGADFQGWLVDGSYTFTKGIQVKGYFGGIEYNDDISSTKDKVSIWMGETSYRKGKWQIAARLSGWDPADDNGDGLLVGPIPNPGLNAGFPVDNTPPNTPTTPGPNVDQSVMRLQVGFSWALKENLVIKTEYVQDDYDKASAGKLGDLSGVILSLNGRF